eukprot:7030953-Pyramimonas_sp.AAC.1
MEPQEKPQKPNHHRRMDGFPRFMRNRRLTSRHALWKCGIQNYKMKRGLLEATPLEDLFTVPTHLIPDSSAHITIADEQRGHLPKWGHPHDSDIEETYHVPLCPAVEDC